MSVQALSCAFALRGVSPSEKLLVLALANYADAQMRCWPSHATLAEDTGLSQRTILTLFKSLEDAKMLSRERRNRPDGSRSSDMIVLHFGGEMVAPRGEIDRQSKPQLSAIGGEVVAPHEPSNNHQIEEPIMRDTKSRRGTRLSVDWKPSEADIQFAWNEGLRPEEIERETDKFRDYWCAKPGAGGVKLDWPATWRNWCRNRGSGSRVAGGSRPGGGGQGVTDFASIIARRR